MPRFEVIGRIVSYLQILSDEALLDLLIELENGFTDESIEVITYGSNDTEHLLSSPSNARDLQQTIEELNGKNLLVPEKEHRMVYAVTNEAIIIAPLRYHY